MPFQKYRNTPLASFQLSDSVVGLVVNHSLTTDVAEGAHHAPFHFDPVRDSIFYNDTYWEAAAATRLDAAKGVKRRFDRWYAEHARPIDKVYLAVVALTDSDDAIDTLIDDIKVNLLRDNVLPLIDADDSIYKITDYHRVRDPAVIASAFNNEQIAWWCQQFEEQARRVLDAPTMPFQEFLQWNERRSAYMRQVQEHFRHNAYNANIEISERQGRKVIARSYRMMAARFGEEQARLFCRGTPIKIRAHYFEWQLKLNPRNLKPYSVSPPTNHVPYSLILNDHEGRELGHVCVLFKQTPVLEQAVSLSLELSHPDDELELLRTANIFALTPEGVRSETLKSLNLPHVAWPDPETAPPWQDGTNELRERFLVDPIRPDEYDSWRLRIEHGIAYGWDEVDQDIDRIVAMQRTREDALVEQYMQEISTILDMPRIEHEGLRGAVTELYRGVLRDRARTVIARQRDPLAQRIRTELYRKLDVRPDVIEYMALPEFRYLYLDRLRGAPRIQNFIEQKTPLGLGAFQ